MLRGARALPFPLQIHAAGSSVGIAAIQLAVSKGAKVIATAGAQEKLDTAKR